MTKEMQNMIAAVAAVNVARGALESASYTVARCNISFTTNQTYLRAADEQLTRLIDDLNREIRRKQAEATETRDPDEVAAYALYKAAALESASYAGVGSKLYYDWDERSKSHRYAENLKVYRAGKKAASTGPDVTIIL
jgi:hypothetical protein